MTDRPAPLPGEGIVEGLGRKNPVHPHHGGIEGVKGVALGIGTFEDPVGPPGTRRTRVGGLQPDLIPAGHLSLQHHAALATPVVILRNDQRLGRTGCLVIGQCQDRAFESLHELQAPFYRLQGEGDILSTLGLGVVHQRNLDENLRLTRLEVRGAIGLTAQDGQRGSRAFQPVGHRGRLPGVEGAPQADLDITVGGPLVDLEAGHPNLTLVEALSCGLPVVGTMEPNNKLDGMKLIELETHSVVQGIRDIIENYEEYSTSARKQAEQLDWYNRTKELVSIYLTQECDMKKQLLSHYAKTPILKKPTVKKFNFNCIEGMFAEVLGGTDTKYSVKFIDKTTNTIVFETEIGRNCWAKPSIKYYVDWKVEMTDKSTGHTTTYDLDLQDKRVYIALDSKSLGDTLAWIPYVEEFRKKHSCKVICSTFWNDMFISEYPEIEFTKPGDTVHNLIAMYVIGLFYTGNQFDTNKHPINPITVSLQQIASDILGLSHKEVRPKIKQPTVDNTESKLVTIATHSTAQSKYWKCMRNE